MVVICKFIHLKNDIVKNHRFLCASVIVSGRHQVAMQQYNLSPL